MAWDGTWRIELDDSDDERTEVTAPDGDHAVSVPAVGSGAPYGRHRRRAGALAAACLLGGVVVGAVVGGHAPPPPTPAGAGSGAAVTGRPLASGGYPDASAVLAAAAGVTGAACADRPVA